MTTFISYFFKIISMNSLLFTRPCHTWNIIWCMFDFAVTYFHFFYPISMYTLRGSTIKCFKIWKIKINYIYIFRVTHTLLCVEKNIMSYTILTSVRHLKFTPIFTQKFRVQKHWL
jgi:hypothetical protein